MANLENVLQAKNADVSGVTAPLIDNYPEGYVDSLKLPLALSWVMDTVHDPAGSIQTSTVTIDVLVEAVGQDRFKKIKEACRALRVLFMVEYLITPSTSVLQNDPAIRINPGSVEFGGYRDLVDAPDGTPFHGFSITLEVTEYLGVTC